MRQKYFGTTFGFAGDNTVIPDPLQSGGQVSFNQGWTYDYQRDQTTDPAAKPIDRATMNWLFGVITAQLQQYQQAAVPEWISATDNGGTPFSYEAGVRVRYSSNPGTVPFSVYVSLIANNTNTPNLADPTGATSKWQLAVYQIASTAQAAAGTDNSTIMTPSLVAQQDALRALLAGSSSQVFNVGPATAATHAPQAQQIRQGVFDYAGDSGTANAYAVAYSPAVSSVNDGMRLRFKAANANTGASTFSPAPGSIASAPILGGNHAALIGGEIVANADIEVVWNSSLNGGSGAWVLLENTGGALQLGAGSYGTTPAQFDNSVRVITSAFLKRRGLEASGVTTTNASNALGATYIGGTLVANAAGATTQTLPAANSVPAGGRIQFLNIGAGTMTISRAGADQIYASSSPVNSIAVGNGDTITLESNGTSVWHAVSGSAQLGTSALFASSLATPGWQQFPGGLILVWGTSNVPNNTDTAVTFPKAFPVAPLNAWATLDLNAAGGNAAAKVTSLTSTGMSVSQNSGGGPYAVRWFAIGH